MEDKELVLTVDQVAKLLKARSLPEARRWISINAPESILFFNPLRVSKELLLVAIARGRLMAPVIPPGGEVIV